MAPIRTPLAALVAAAILLLTGIKARRASGPVGAIGAGFASGVANGLSALGGLPIALLLVARSDQPAVIRATMIGYFFLLDSYAAGLLAHQGLMTGLVVERYALGLPFALIGIVAGGRVFSNSNPDNFRKIVLGLLIALSAVSLVRSATGG